MMSDFSMDKFQDSATMDDLRDLVNRVARYPNPDRPVIFYGSSSFRLWDPTIRSDLNSDSIVNLAFGGSTLVSCHDWFDRIMSPYCRPRSMVVYAGDNDLGQGRSALSVKDGFLRILEKVEARFGMIPVFFVSIKPSPSKQSIFGEIVRSNRYVAEEAEERENLQYIDIVTPMLTSSGDGDPAYFTDDNLHMNDAGYRIWKNVLLNHRSAIGL